MTFGEACAAIAAVQAAERADERIDPIAYTRFMTHGAPADRAIAFYHGFTNCPQQFVELGRQFFDAGYNVYVPRLPGHGLRDKLTTALAQVPVGALTSAAADAAHLAMGLGSRAHVAGISLGGVLAAWVGESIPVAGATAIAPFLAIAGVPMWANTALAACLEAMPNFFMWWDPRTKAQNPRTPPYAYPRYPIHQLAGQLRISARLQRAARANAPQARVSCLFVNVHDPAISVSVAERLYERWSKEGARVVCKRFDGGRLPHDIIDNSRHHLPIGQIYPAIFDTIEEADRIA